MISGCHEGKEVRMKGRDRETHRDTRPTVKPSMSATGTRTGSAVVVTNGGSGHSEGEANRTHGWTSWWQFIQY